MDDIKIPRPRQSSMPSSKPLNDPKAQQQSQTLPTIEEAPETSPKAPKLPKKRSKKWLIWLIVALLLLLVAGAVGTVAWYNDALQPKSSTVHRIRITVEPGSTAETIGQQLQDKGVIKSALAFQWYAKLSGKLASLKAGSYLFSPTQSVNEIVTWLSEGRVDSFRVTILPGKTLSDIKKSLINDGFEASAIDAAFAKTYDHPLLKDRPASATLEGYIFPETYEITSETTVEQLLVKTFDIFEQRLEADNLRQALADRGYSLFDGITLASIVQLEVPAPDRHQVAQVFEKRLKEDMPLGSDVTYLYGATLTGEEATPSLDSPYNTRIHTGLPPGPISNFTLDSLDAVASPAPGDYLYFVAGDDGTTHFSRTLEEHNAAIREFCTKLCQ